MVIFKNIISYFGVGLKHASDNNSTYYEGWRERMGKEVVKKRKCQCSYCGKRLKKKLVESDFCEDYTDYCEGNSLICLECRYKPREEIKLIRYIRARFPKENR